MARRPLAISAFSFFFSVSGSEDVIVAHGSPHGDTPVLQFGCPAAIKGGDVSVRTQPQWVPVAQRWLHTNLALEGAQRRASVERPVAPGRAGQSILEKHANYSHHGQAAVSYLGCPC